MYWNTGHVGITLFFIKDTIYNLQSPRTMMKLALDTLDICYTKAGVITDHNKTQWLLEE